MTIDELHIKLDLQYENKINILKDVAIKCNEGYLFIDSSNGHCYLFDKNGNEDDIKKIKSIGEDAFAYCENLESIEIPDSVKSIGIDAFWFCKNLKSIIIPDSVTSIRNFTFLGCTNLKSLTFKRKTIDQVKAMRNYPFGIKDESIIRCI
ncbi:MAG: leucine-rich repeat protein [Methanobrevibacter sp.]|nr:leucine-rich repeat protein [Methanobrevibacter sp.]